MTIWHLKDIMAGKRSKVKGKDVLHIAVPQYPSLTVEAFINFAKNHQTVMQALPVVEAEIFKLPRAYIANIIHTLLGEPFKKWVKARVDERHQKLVQERAL